MPRAKKITKRKVGSTYKGDAHYVPPVGPYLHIPNYSYYLRM